MAKFEVGLYQMLRREKNMSLQDVVDALNKKGIEITLDGVKAWTRTSNPVSPDFDKIIALTEILGVEPDALLSGLKIVRKTNQNENTLSVPIIDALAGCGASGLLEQLRFTDEKMVIDKRVFPQDVISKDLAMIRIVGDSMNPYLEENDWAMIQLRNGYDVVYADSVYLVAHGDNVQIKRCHFMADGSCLLISDNQLYPSEKAYAGDWDIVGKVVARIKMGSLMQFK